MAAVLSNRSLAWRFFGRSHVCTGRLPEATNGSFVEAHHEKTALSVGQLWRDPKGGSGLASAGRARDLTAGKLLPKLSDRIADGRGRQYPTQT